MRGINTFILSTREWGDIKIGRILPKNGSSWGVLQFLEDTVWGNQIPTIDGYTISDALHGRTRPLLEVLGSPPIQRMKKISEEDGWCMHKLSKECAMATENCKPNKKVPDCYEPTGYSLSETNMIANLVLLWKENVYVIRVVGEEFSLL